MQKIKYKTSTRQNPYYLGDTLHYWTMVSLINEYEHHNKGLTILAIHSFHIYYLPHKNIL